VLGVAEMSTEPTLKPFVAATGARLGRGFDSAANGMFKNYRNWGGTAGVTLEWNFGTPRLEYERQAAALGLSAARLGLDQVRNSVSGQMDELRIQMRSTRGLVELLARQRALNTEYLEIEKARFLVGRSTAFVLTTAYQGYQGVVSMMPDLVAQWYKASWRIDSLRGTLLASFKEDVRGSADSAR
jgi:outer membrane protein TolC